ncbi:MAG: bifunctional demethylmenaquinone methyltransferase/2-methoxy-6-polyprenyl-1,4-benzoquinol methylase UbiE [Bacteroidales bacterium]
MTGSDSKISKDENGIGPMFDSIARRYDFLNHLLSFGVDRSWRRKTVQLISEYCSEPRIIDVATGTGDLAIEASRIGPAMIRGIDISERMLELARRKVDRKRLSGMIEFARCDSENICFRDCTFDVAMVAFGVRNFSDPEKSLAEMRRVVKPGGLIVILEFSKPASFPFKQAYNLYFKNLLPLIGRVFSKNRGAYRYLHDSVMKFADNEEFMAILKNAGFANVRQMRLTSGVATIYSGIRQVIQ